MNNTAITVDDYLLSLPAWQAAKLSEFRTLIHDTDSSIAEEIKWGVPAFIFNKKVSFTMAAFKNHVKYNFIANGATLNDPSGLFNNGLESTKSRSIDSKEDESIDQTALKDLIKQALRS